MASATAVSVIIPCYRAEGFIQRPIRSLLAQTFTNWEAVLVSDDGVDYAAVLSSKGIDDARITHTSTGKTGSRAGNARNIGLDHVNANIVAYLDADDAYLPNYLAHIVPLVKQHGVVFSNQQFIDEESGKDIAFFDVLKSRFGPFSMNEFPLLMAPPGAVCIAHDRVRVPARWYAETIVAEDVLFPLQCYAHVDYIYGTAEPLYQYYKRKESTSHNQELMKRFIAQKEKLLEDIACGKLLNENPALAQTAQRCTEIALAAERRFASMLLSNPHLLYSDCVVQELKLAGVL